jgi:hypothetical protein
LHNNQLSCNKNISITLSCKKKLIEERLEAKGIRQKEGIGGNGETGKRGKERNGETGKRGQG